jgi:hypothetical protein
MVKPVMPYTQARNRWSQNTVKGDGKDVEKENKQGEKRGNKHGRYLLHQSSGTDGLRRLSIEKYTRRLRSHRIRMQSHYQAKDV